MPKSILILTQLQDTHAIAVKMAAERKGARAVRWFTHELGLSEQGTVRISPGQPARAELLGPQGGFTSEEVGTVWCRRPAFPSAGETVHPEDREQVFQENSFFVQSVWWTLTQGTRWVNPYAARKRVKNKVAQLMVAREVGLTIPDTLYSNHPAHIREFCAAHQATGVIYKPHRVFQWEDTPEGTFLAQTSIIDDISRFSDTQLSLCAGVFQPRVPKAYELRLNFMGDFCVAAKLLSQEDPRAQVDWRKAPLGALGIEPYTLPGPVLDKCRALLREFGLAFGCLDLIVTPDGDYVFLEINEMGQFLWIEKRNPEIRLLDHFTSFLMKEDGAYDGRPVGEPVSYAELVRQGEIAAALDRDRAVRKPTERPFDWIDALL
jgi:hypothetical protein